MSNKFAYPFNPIEWPASPHDFTGNHNLGIYTAETTQRYMLGVRHITWDGRVFKYAKSSGACWSGQGALNATAPFIADDGSTTIHNANVVGDTVVDIEIQTVAKDALAGGYIIIYTGADNSTHQFRSIVANTVGAGTTIEVTLERPLTAVTVLDTTAICAYYSPYYGLIKSNLVNVSTLGVPATFVSAANMFFWLQTWGPCRCSPGEAGYGADDGERQMVFGNNGGLFHHDGDHATTLQLQHAGFIIPRTVGADDAPLVMLQISI